MVLIMVSFWSAFLDYDSNVFMDTTGYVDLRVSGTAGNEKGHVNWSVYGETYLRYQELSNVEFTGGLFFGDPGIACNARFFTSDYSAYNEISIYFDLLKKFYPANSLLLKPEISTGVEILPVSRAYSNLFLDGDLFFSRWWERGITLSGDFGVSGGYFYNPSGDTVPGISGKFNGRLRLAYSIGGVTGIYIEGKFTKNLIQGSGYTAPGALFEEFWDFYPYTGFTVRTALKNQTEERSLGIKGKIQKVIFEQREDFLTGVYLNASFSQSPGFFISCGIERNVSTDGDYSYNRCIVSLGIGAE